MIQIEPGKVLFPMDSKLRRFEPMSLLEALRVSRQNGYSLLGGAAE